MVDTLAPTSLPESFFTSDVDLNGRAAFGSPTSVNVPALVVSPGLAYRIAVRFTATQDFKVSLLSDGALVAPMVAGQPANPVHETEISQVFLGQVYVQDGREQLAFSSIEPHVPGRGQDDIPPVSDPYGPGTSSNITFAGTGVEYDFGDKALNDYMTPAQKEAGALHFVQLDIHHRSGLYTQGSGPFATTYDYTNDYVLIFTAASNVYAPSSPIDTNENPGRLLIAWGDPQGQRGAQWEAWLDTVSADPAQARLAVNPEVSPGNDTLPVVRGLSLGDGAGGAKLAVQGSAASGSRVTVFDAAVPLGSVTAGLDGNWRLTLTADLAAGGHALRATATDALGKASMSLAALPVVVRGEQAGTAPPAAISLDAGARGVQVARSSTGDVALNRNGETQVLRNTDELRFIDGRLVFDTEDPASKITRLYRAGLGREVDQGGLEHWKGVLQGGASLSAIAQGFLTSPEGQGLYGADLPNGDFVARLYENILGRESDAGGLAFWTGRLQEGGSRAEVLAALSESAENKAAAAQPGGLWDADEGAAVVARVYDTVLGRLPDAGGLAFWSDAIGSGHTTLQGMAEQFMALPEYQTVYGGLFNTDFVQTTYRNTLDRQGEASGVTYWTEQLNAGLPRSAVVAAFSESQEHVSLTATDILGTKPGQLGIRLA